jgi:tetratricopeptide (TPR) repeat protein
VGDMKYRRLLKFLPLLLLALSACSRDPKVRAKRYVDNGNKFFNKGTLAGYKDASIMYRRALKEDARNGDAWYHRALTDYKLSNYSDAFTSLSNTVELQPANTDAKSKLADLYLIASMQSQNKEQQGKDLDGAKDIADKLVQQDPKSFDGHRILGQLALVKQDAGTAIAEFQAANASKPLSPQVVVPYVQALAASNRFPEGEALAYQMIAKDKTNATVYDILYAEYARLHRLEDAERIVKLKSSNNPKNASYLLQLAVFYIQTKRRDEAESVLKAMTDEKEHPDGHMLAGDFFFFRMREFERARAQYDAAIKAFPKDKVAYEKRLVELDATTLDNNSANQLLADILKDNPKDSDAIAMRAALMLTTGNRDQINMAANDLQSLVTKNPDNYVLRYNLARALHAKNQDEQALLQLDAAIKLRPDFMKARELAASLYVGRGDSTRALKAADDIIAKNSGDLQGHLVRSSALLSIGQRDQARKELDYIVKTFPQNVEARYQVGFLDFLDKDYKAAEEVFSKLYKDFPKDHRGLVGVTETLVKQGRVPEAIAEMKKASDAEPDRRDLKLFLANLNVTGEKYEDAIQIYQGLLDKSPKDAGLLYRQGETYRRKGDLNIAVDKFRLASQASPNDPRPMIELALILDGTGRADQAQPIYEQILKIQPDHAIALNNLAFIKAEKGQDLEEALGMARRAQQKNPNSAEIADTLGWIYIRKHLSEEAVQVFQKLVVQEPDNPIFHLHYGMALQEKGDKTSAQKQLQEALKDHPSKPQEQQIRELLQKLG